MRRGPESQKKKEVF